MVAATFNEPETSFEQGKSHALAMSKEPKPYIPNRTWSSATNVRIGKKLPQTATGGSRITNNNYSPVRQETCTALDCSRGTASSRMVGRGKTNPKGFVMSASAKNLIYRPPS